MAYKPNRYEMETSILWNEEEKTCTCYTCSPALQRRLNDLCSKSPDIHREEIGGGGVRYTFPKKWVRVVLPHSLSSEEREKRALHMREINSAKREAALHES